MINENNESDITLSGEIFSISKDENNPNNHMILIRYNRISYSDYHMDENGEISYPHGGCGGGGETQGRIMISMPKYYAAKSFVGKKVCISFEPDKNKNQNEGAIGN